MAAGASDGDITRASLLGRLYRDYERLIIGGGSVLLVLLVWETVVRAGFADPLFLPAPTQIVQAAIALFAEGEIWVHLRVSGSEFLVGYALSALIGIPLGLATGWYRRLSYVLGPFIDTLNAVPRLTLMPIIVIWFGIGIWSKVIVVITLVLFPVTINTEAGLRTTSERLIEMLRSFGASKQQIFFKVSLPSAVPFILAGLKLGIGRGLIGVVVAELFGSRAGLGNLISQSADAFNMPELFAGVVILAFAGIVMTAGFGKLEQHLVPWTRD